MSGLLTIGRTVIPTRSDALLLDTHVWLIYQGLPGSLKEATENVIEAAAQRNAVFVSLISVWEIAMLARSKRVQLEGGVRRWIDRALAMGGIALLPYSAEIAIESVDLPEPVHRDSADRILVASARVERLTLVTSDEKMLRFAERTGLSHLRA